MKTPQKIIAETRSAARLVEQCGDAIQQSIEIGNLLHGDRAKLDKLVSDLYEVAIDLHKSTGEMERENIDEDTFVTREAEMLVGHFHPRRITLLEEYGDRVLVMSLDEAESFEKSSGYMLEDIVPDFMFGEILNHLKHKGAFEYA